MKALITGAAGQLGTDLTRWCEQAGDEVIALARTELDIGQPDQVEAAISHHRPDVVFNCAAWTAVDACESDHERANLLNGQAVGFLGQAAANVDAHLVHISTDYVFDGEKSEPYTEADAPNPQTAYGASKLLGEAKAQTVGATVVRTSWVGSVHGDNMVATILRLAAQHPTLTFVDDQRGHPTFTADLAPALRQLGIDRHDDIIHVTNAGAVSWFEFAQAVLSAAGEDPNRVTPIHAVDLLPARPAPRPKNSVLSNDHFVSLGYPRLRDFREALAEVVTAYL